MSAVAAFLACTPVARTAGSATIHVVTGLGPRSGVPAAEEPFTEPLDVSIDASGNLFVSDWYDPHVRLARVDAASGVLTTVASPSSPYGSKVDANGDVYFADFGRHRVLRIMAGTGAITVVAGTGAAGFSGDGGPATDATLSIPYDIDFDAAGNLYIVDGGNFRVRRVDATSGIITTIAGNGHSLDTGDGWPATDAGMRPVGIALDSDDNVFISSLGNRIRRIDAITGTITTYAGSGTYGYSGDGGPATEATFRSANLLALDSADNLFVADYGNHVVRRIDAATGVVTTFAGSTPGYSGDGGQATSARLLFPNGLDVDAAGNLFIADYGNHVIRRVAIGSGIITTVAGLGTPGFLGDGGAASRAALFEPVTVTVAPDGDILIAGFRNYRVRRIDAASGVISTFAGTGIRDSFGDGGPAVNAGIFPIDLVTDSSGNVYISDLNHRVRRVDAVTGTITTIAGTGTAGFSGDGGPATAAQSQTPHGLAVCSDGFLFVADYGNRRVRRIDFSTGTITTYAGDGTTGSTGDGGPATSASLAGPTGLSLDRAGNLLIADNGSHRIRRIAARTGIISTVAGNGTASPFTDGADALSTAVANPLSVGVDAHDNLFISASERVLRVDALTGIVTAVAGSGGTGGGDGAGDGGSATPIAFRFLYGMTVAPNGAIYAAERGGHRLWRIDGATTPVDSVPPIIVCPDNLSAGCNPAMVVPVTFSVTATDNTDSSPAVACTPSSGSGFPTGTTEVNCTATDASAIDPPAHSQ